MTNTTRFMLGAALALGFQGTASAGIADWLSAATTSGAGYTNSDIMSPITDDIGAYDAFTGGGVTYEVIVNATNDDASSALIGYRDRDAVFAGGAIKWEQWPDSLAYGATLYEVADLYSSVPNTPDIDTHLAFVADGFDMHIYVNGVFAETLSGGSFALSGVVGIGQTYDPTTGSFDFLTGTILGVAVYDSALPEGTITGHYDAFALASEVTGDTDGDGDIDDFDLLNAISNFTGSLAAGTGGKGVPEGDTDTDADVDDFDLLTMISGFTGSLSAPAVPEPASLALLGLSGTLVARRRNRA